MKEEWFFESAIESITTTGTDLAASSIGAPRPSKEVAPITTASEPAATASSKTLIWPAEWTHAHSGEILKFGKKYIITGWMCFPFN